MTATEPPSTEGCISVQEFLEPEPRTAPLAGAVESLEVPDHSIDRPTIKAALLLGFGLTLGLWLWAGYDFIRRMSVVQSESAAISLRYMQAQELLANVRPQVLTISVNVRTALLDPTMANREEYRQRIQRTVASVGETLEQYVPVLNSDVERERVARLRREVDSFGFAVLDVLSSSQAVAPLEVRELLARIVPRRELVIGVTDEVQALNRAAFVEQQTAIAEAYRQTQRRVWERLGMSLIASLAIAAFAILYASRLESRLRGQREREMQHTRDLQRLSATLVDAQEQERRVIARELHDELGQVLMAVNVELSLAEKKLQHSGAGHLLSDAQAITRTALHSVRDLSHALHPALLDDLGLVAALDSYVLGIGKRHGIRTRFEQEGTARRAHPDIELAAYRIVQEAVMNAVKHASANACTVTVRHFTARLMVVVEDDGRGFDPDEVQLAGAAAGLGLIGMRERVTQLGGNLHVASVEGEGTTVTVEFPLPGRDATLSLAGPRVESLKRGGLRG